MAHRDGVAAEMTITAGNEMDIERADDPMSRVERFTAMAKREADRVKRLFTGDPEAPAKKRKGRKAAVLIIAKPTPEQIDSFELGPVRTERGQVLGQAYRRQPHFESLAKREMGEARKEGRAPLIGEPELRALRFYRAAFEGADRSETKCALDIRPRSSAGSSDRGVSSAVIQAKRDLEICEADIGPILGVFRSVALHDRTYQQVAMERFGSRDADWFDDKLGAFTTRPVPRSTRHTAVIRAEFLQGLAQLVLSTQAMLSAEG